MNIQHGQYEKSSSDHILHGGEWEEYLLELSDISVRPKHVIQQPDTSIWSNQTGLR